MAEEEKRLQLPEWRPMPTYYQCISAVYETFSRELCKHYETHNMLEWPFDFYGYTKRYMSITQQEVTNVIFLAIFWTALRFCLTSLLFKPLAMSLDLVPKNADKFPESVWKVMYFSLAWSASFYILVFSGKSIYLYQPHHIWNGWQPFMSLPVFEYWIYMVQFSYYLHAIFATLYMDVWRRDSAVMLFHHVLTMALIGFSFAARYYKIGILVLFVHDIADICLEFAKCNVYLKHRGGRYHRVNDVLSTISFFGFTISWFYFRLYLFPLRVLYSSGYECTKHGFDDIPFYIFFNTMLWLLQILNIYWFSFILNLLYNVLLGNINGVEDVREKEVIEKINNNKNLKVQCTNGYYKSLQNGTKNE